MDSSYKPKLKIVNLILVTILYVSMIYSVFHIICFAKSVLYTFLLMVVIGIMSGLGVTAGVHRLWSHRSYKATLPLRIFLAMCYSIAGQNSIYDWVRDHRVHHKYSDTDADPHNIKKGFFFSHVGWLMYEKHPQVKEKGKSISLQDIMDDPVVYYHTKFFPLFKILFAYVIPSMLPIYLWNEYPGVAILSQAFLRYGLILNITWSVNSFAHMFGNKPYNKNLHPSENKIVSMFALGEGWHNYHHVFPYDYKTSEFGNSKNITAMFLDLCEKFGMVYDKKQPSKETIEKFMKELGDGTCHPNHEASKID